MALLDKVRQTLSNIGQKIDQNPTKTGVQLLPPVNFKQNVRNLLNTQVSVLKPIARLTTNLANITPGRIASQGLLQNKPLQAFAQAGLRATPLIQQPFKTAAQTPVTGPVPQAFMRGIDTLNKLPSSQFVSGRGRELAQRVVGGVENLKQPGLFNKGVGALQLTAGVLGATPVGMYREALVGVPLAGIKTARNVAQGNKAQFGKELLQGTTGVTTLGSSVTDNPAAQAAIDIVNMALGFYKGGRFDPETRYLESISNLPDNFKIVKPVDLTRPELKYKTEFNPVEGGLFDLKKAVSDLDKKIVGRIFVNASQTRKVDPTEIEDVMNLGNKYLKGVNTRTFTPEQIITELYKQTYAPRMSRFLSTVDTPKLSVEPTGKLDAQTLKEYESIKNSEYFSDNKNLAKSLIELENFKDTTTYKALDQLRKDRGIKDVYSEAVVKPTTPEALPTKTVDLKGFGENLDPKNKSRATIILSSKTRIDGGSEVITKAEKIEKLLGQGYKSETISGKPVLKNASGKYYEVTKIESDYAKHLSQLSPSKPLSVEPVGGGTIANKPLYHGTNAKFDKFDLEMSGEVQPGDWGAGAYFTDKPGVAKNFAKVAGGDIVMTRYAPDAKFADGQKLMKDPEFQNAMDWSNDMDPDAIVDYIKSKGYDGVKVHHTDNGGWDEYVVYNTDKIITSPLGGKVGEVTKPVEMPQLSKQLESIQPAPKALGDLGISTKPQPELQKAQTLRNLKQESVPLDNIISEARKQIGTTPEPKDKNVKQVMDDLYTQWVSRYNPIEEASRKAKKTLKTKGAELRPEFDPEYLVRRLTGAGGIADYRFKTELNPIIKEMESLNIPKSDMDVYLANKRIAGFGKAGRDIYGADPKKAQEVVAAIESKYGNIQGLAQKFYDYQNKGFQEMVDAGFISPEAAKTIKSQNPDYAPLYRVMDEMDEYLGLPTRKTMQGTQPISKLKGSTRQIESPVESIIGNTFKQRAAIEKNRVAQSIVGLQNIADMGFTKTTKASPETITVWNNGKKEYWNVGKDIAETAKGQNEEQMNLLLKVLQAPASLLRQGATGRNPEFLLPNIIRDQLDAGITSKYGYIPFVDFTSGLISMAKNDDVYKKWANSGAKIDLGEISGKKSIQELFNSKVEKKKLSTWLSQGLDALGTLSEQPTRVGLFKKAYKKTGNELLAMMESRDATVDFARMGSKMKVANSIIPFLNVGVQGFDKLIRAVKNNPGRVALNAGIYGALPAIMTTLYNLNKDPEAYAEIPQYEKDSNFILVIGRNKNGTVDYLTFPKGNVIPTIANPIESFLAFTKNEDPEAFKQMLTQTLTSTLPVVGDGATAGEVATKTIGGLIPQGIKPLAENLLNKSFYKYDPKKEQSKEIVPYYMQNKPAYQQTYDFTPQMYQKIGAVFNASPLKVKNLMEGYLAGYTKIPSQIVEMMYKTSRGEEISPNEKTLMRRFIKQTYPNSGKEPEVKPEVPGLMERVTGKVGAAETAPVKEIKYKRASDNSTQTIKLSDLQKPTGTTLKDYLSSGNRESTIREIYKGYATGAIKEADMQSAFKTAGVTVKEAEDMVIKELPLAQKSSLVYDRLVSPTSTTKDLDSMVESKLLTTNVITELTDSGKITEEQSKALKNYLKQKSGKVSKGKKPKKFKPTKFKAIKLKGAKKTYLKQKKLTLKDLLRK